MLDASLVIHRHPHLSTQANPYGDGLRASSRLPCLPNCPALLGIRVLCTDADTGR